MLKWAFWKVYFVSQLSIAIDVVCVILQPEHESPDLESVGFVAIHYAAPNKMANLLQAGRTSKTIGLTTEKMIESK